MLRPWALIVARRTDLRLMGTRACCARGAIRSTWVNSSQTNQTGPWDIKNFKSGLLKLSHIIRPPPSGTFVFIDEHEDTIDDGLGNTDPGGLVAPGVPVLSHSGNDYWDNLPAERHNQGANIAFADTHV